MPHRRKDSPYWQITVAGTRRSSETTDRKKAADLEHKLNAEAWDRENFGVRFETWDETTLDWLKKHAALKSLRTQRSILTFWNGHFDGSRMRSINGERVRQILMKRPGVDPYVAMKANGTANQYAGFVGKMMRHARLDFEFKAFPELDGADEWLRLEQWKALEAVMPAEWRQTATFSLVTGLREANVIGLQWDWLRSDSLVIPAEHAKTARPYGIPLNKTAQQIIAERRKATVPHLTNVFSIDGRVIYCTMLHRAWQKFFRAAQVPYVTYHGLRHTYASWMVQAGVPFEIVERLCHWRVKGRGMVHRYAHFDIEPLRPYAAVMDTLLARNAEPQSVSA